MNDVFKIAAYVPMSADLFDDAREAAEYIRKVRSGEIVPAPPPPRFSTLTGRPVGRFRRA